MTNSDRQLLADLDTIEVWFQFACGLLRLMIGGRK